MYTYYKMRPRNKTLKKRFPSRIYLYSNPRLAQKMAYKYLIMKLIVLVRASELVSRTYTIEAGAGN